MNHPNPSKLTILDELVEYGLGGVGGGTEILDLNHSLGLI